MNNVSAFEEPENTVTIKFMLKKKFDSEKEALIFLPKKRNKMQCSCDANSAPKIK